MIYHYIQSQIIYGTSFCEEKETNTPEYKVLTIFNGRNKYDSKKLNKVTIANETFRSTKIQTN